MTTVGMHLLRRETPLGGESFGGYLTRMAQKNGYDSAVWLLSAGGIRCKHGVSTNISFCDSAAGLVGLASLLGLDVSELLTLSYPRPTSKDARTDYTFFGHRVQQYVLRPDRPKVCPACLGEAAHSRRIWECSLVTTCPRHGRLLIDHCPGCSRRISWLRGKVCVCGCGYDWREAAPAMPLPDKELALTKYVHQLCGVKTAGEEANWQPPSNPLFTLSLRGLVSAVTFIASQSRGISCSTGRYITSTARNDSLHETFSRAYRVFEDWPVRYHEFLGQHQACAGKGGKLRSGGHPSLGASFGRIYSGLYTTLEAPEFDFMRAGFASYVFTQWTGQTTTPRSPVEHSLPHPGKYITGTETRHLLEVSGYHLAYLIETGQLRVVTPRKKRSRSLNLIEVNDLVSRP
ncbi:MAG: TniQ family protein [Acidobacteria bacterium]|nr:TniQ family protein [Acidobacteriota bacterium]